MIGIEKVEGKECWVVVLFFNGMQVIFNGIDCHTFGALICRIALHPASTRQELLVSSGTTAVWVKKDLDCRGAWSAARCE